MPRTLFNTRFGDIAVKESTAIQVEGASDLPDGEYVLVETYCDDLDCDCRRVSIDVMAPHLPNRYIATIDYGWESPEFYEKWTGGGVDIHMMKGPALAMVPGQSEYAPAILIRFTALLEDREFVASLERHYNLFRTALAEIHRQKEELTLDGILEAIRHERRPFPEAALLAAIERPDEIIPKLLQVLEETIENAETLADHPTYAAHMSAILLLAELRERRAADPLIRLCSLPGKIVSRLLGDFLPDHLGDVLASVTRGDIHVVQRLVESQAATSAVRTGALNALPAMVAARELPREAALAYLGAILRGSVDIGPQDAGFGLFEAAVLHAAALHPEEILEDIRKAFQKRRVNTGIVGIDDVMKRLQSSRQDVLAELPEHYPLVTDAIALLEDWWIEQEEELGDEDGDEELEDEDPELDPDLPLERSLPAGTLARLLAPSPEEPYIPPLEPTTIRRDSPRIGRNDPCPCGSGRKYKKCCEGKA